LGYEEKDSDKSNPVALKLLFDKMEDGQSTFEMVQQEIKIMESLNHPNIV
jgi:serine/threonine protein kinase